MKVIVMVTGLVLTATPPATDWSEFRVLFPKTKGFTDSLGKSVHEHQVAISTGKNTPLPGSAIAARPFTIEVSPKQPRDATVGINDTQYFSHLDELAKGVDLQAGCLDGDVKRCQYQGKDLLDGRLILEDDWHLRALSACDASTPVSRSDATTLHFRTRLAAGGTSTNTLRPGTREIANTFAFERSVSKLDEVELEINGTKYPLSSSGATCQDYDPQLKDCAIVWITHHPVAGGHVDCSSKPNDPACLIDSHFEHLYAFLETTPAQRWVPVVEGSPRDCKEGGVGGPPYGRCYPSGYP